MSNQVTQRELKLPPNATDTVYDKGSVHKHVLKLEPEEASRTTEVPLFIHCT